MKVLMVGLVSLAPVLGYLNSKHLFIVRQSVIFLKEKDDVPLLYKDDDFSGVRIGVKSVDEIKEERNEELRAKGVIGIRKSEEIQVSEARVSQRTTPRKTFGGFDMEELYRKSNIAMKEIKSPQKNRKEDFSAVNPLQSLISAVVTMSMCVCAWIASGYFAQHFAIDYIHSEFYPVQRIAIVGRNLIVGIFSLASGFTGVVSLGLLLLTGRAIYGKLNGEYPNSESEEK